MSLTESMTATLLFKALKTAAIVGSSLLLINQYDALFGDASLRILPAVLTYCVPFLVFLYGNLSKEP